jgi:uncharacterized membrane protein YvbJ
MLMECPDCYYPISTNATFCTRCGRTIQPSDIPPQPTPEQIERAKRKNARFNRILLIIFGIAVVLAIIVFGFIAPGR